MNYTYQSFNMGGKSKIRPYYDLVANIAAEEMWHIEIVANTVNLLLDQTEASTDGVAPPLNFTGMTGNPDHFLNFGLGTIPGGASVKAWTGENVFNSGNLKLDLLHNFFPESGARMGKIRVYEATQNPVAREMIGYLIARRRPPGGLRQGALRPLGRGHHQAPAGGAGDPWSDNFPHAKKFMDKGFHRFLYKFSPSRAGAPCSTTPTLTTTTSAAAVATGSTTCPSRVLGGCASPAGRGSSWTARPCSCAALSSVLRGRRGARCRRLGRLAAPLAR